MPTYMLEGEGEIRLSDRPLTLSLRLEGVATGARLEAVGPAGPIDSVVRPRPDLLIIPRVTDRMTIRVVPVDGRLFPSPLIAHLSLMVDNPTQNDSERAVLRAVSLDALATRDLLVIEHLEGRIAVRAVESEDPEVQLEAVADATRVAAIKMLGVRSVDAMVALNVVIAVDSSASMTALRTDGTLKDVVQILVGLASVIAPRMAIGAATVGSTVSRRRVSSVSDIGSELADLQRDSVHDSGLRSGAPGLLGFVPGANTVTYLITDAVPADADAFEAADLVDGEARHLVVVGTNSAWNLQRSPATPATHIATVAGDGGLGQRLVADPAALRSLVASLLRGCFAPGTSAYDRANA